MDCRRNPWRLFSLSSCLHLRMSHWISHSSKCFSFSPIIMLASSLPYSPGFVSELFKKVNTFPLVWQLSRERSPWLSGSRGAEAVLLVISTVFSRWQWMLLEKFWAWFLSVGLESTSAHNGIFSIIRKSYLLVTKMNMRNPTVVLPVNTVYSMRGICNFAACNSKSLENTTYTSFFFPFSYEKTPFFTYFPQMS